VERQRGGASRPRPGFLATLESLAVRTTDDFDASTANPETVEFASASPECWTMEDVDGNGEMDLLFHFKTQELKPVPGQHQGHPDWRDS